MQQAHATAGISREVTSGSHHVASPLATRSCLSIPVFTSRSDYDVVCYLRTKDRIALSRFFSSLSRFYHFIAVRILFPKSLYWFCPCGLSLGVAFSLRICKADVNNGLTVETF